MARQRKQESDTRSMPKVENLSIVKIDDTKTELWDFDVYYGTIERRELKWNVIDIEGTPWFKVGKFESATFLARRYRFLLTPRMKNVKGIHYGIYKRLARFHSKQEFMGQSE